MRILLVSDFYPPAPGGLESHVRRLGQGLAARGHTVAVLAGGSEEGTCEDGSVSVKIARPLVARGESLVRAGRPHHPPWSDRYFRRALIDMVRAFRPQVVHAHGWCMFSAKGLGIPLIVTLHDHGSRCPKRTLLRHGRECSTGVGLRCLSCSSETQGFLKRAAFATPIPRSMRELDRHVATYIAVSRSVANRFSEMGASVPDLLVVPNFFDMPSPTPSDPPERFEVLFVGPDSPHKGRHVLLDAWRRLALPDARLVIVGPGTEASVPHTWFAGPLGGDQLWERYRASSVVVAPAVWPEPCATVGLETMGFGRALVASRIGGFTDLVADGYTGVLVTPGSATALAEALARLASDPEAVRTMGYAARQRSAMFDSAAVIPRIEQLYAEAVG